MRPNKTCPVGLRWATRAAVELVFEWPFFAILQQAVLPKEFVAPKSDELLA